MSRIDLNRKASCIKDLLFGPKREINLLMLRFQRVLYASMCVLFAAAGIESFLWQLS